VIPVVVKWVDIAVGGHVSLRRTLSVLTIILTGLALASALSTILLTNYLDRTVSLLRTNLESVRLGQEIEIDLLAYSRSTDRMVLTLFESDLQREFHGAKQYITTDEERQMLADAEAQVERVFQLRRSTGVSPVELSVDIDKALSDLRRFVDVNVEQAHEVENEVANVDRIAEQAAIVIAVVLVVGVATVLVWLGWFAFRPLFGIGDAMNAFAAGDPNARAPEIGMQELRRIAQQFNGMAEALSRQRENQLAFLTGVAHDLRNPIGALKMSTAIVDPTRPLPQENRVREIMGVVRRQIDHLNRMIEDLLDAYRIESGNLELRPQELDAREMVRDAFELFRNVSTAHQLSIEVPETAVPVTCDANRISQVLNNLLSNAIKYSPHGGGILIRLEQTASYISIAVSDTGIGIPPEDIPHIFEPFRRARLSSRDFPGVGLGLHVVQRIVQAHHGRIDVKSRVGEGTTFKVWIPSGNSTSQAGVVDVEHIA
jgi:signal transduction histidine kinase